MGLKTTGINKHGANVTYVNIDGVGNVNLDTYNQRVTLTIKPNLFTSKTYRDKENSTPLNTNEGADYENVVIEGENYNNIMTVLYQALKEKERYQDAEDC